MCPSRAGLGSQVTPMRVSEVPSEIARSPSPTTPSPARALMSHGLLPLALKARAGASQARAAGRPGWRAAHLPGRWDCRRCRRPLGRTLAARAAAANTGRWFRAQWTGRRWGPAWPAVRPPPLARLRQADVGHGMQQRDQQRKLKNINLERMRSQVAEPATQAQAVGSQTRLRRSIKFIPLASAASIGA